MSESLIAKTLEGLGYQVHWQDNPEFDLIARRDASNDLLVEVGRLSPFRLRDAYGQIAVASLRLEHACSSTPGRPLVALVIDRLTTRSQQKLHEFMSTYAPNLNWLIVDGDGRRWWKIGRDVGDDQHGFLSDTQDREAESRDLFSPGFQLLLKNILLAGINQDLATVPTKLPQTWLGLAQLTGLSQPYVSAFARALVLAGHLASPRSGFRLQEVGRLITTWASTYNRRPGTRVWARALVPRRSQEKTVSNVLAAIRSLSDEKRRRYAVGSHAAVRLLGVRRSNMGSLRLYMRAINSEDLEDLDLVESDPVDADIELIQPRAEDSVFLPAVERDGVQVVDVLQCYLDVRTSAARGEEVSEYLYENKLHPHFLRRELV